MIRPLRQAAEGSTDGAGARVIDVVRIDLAHRGGSHADGDRRFPDLASQSNPIGFGHALGVIDAGNGAAVGGHDDGACDDGAREGAPSNLIDSGEQRTMRGAQLALDTAPPLSPVSHARNYVAAGMNPTVSFQLSGVVVSGMATRTFFSRMRVAFPASERR